MIKLYDHQLKLLEKNPPKHLICFDTGTGKTIMAIELAWKNKVEPLIICPKSLKEKWKRDWINWANENFKYEIAIEGRMVLKLPKIMSKEEFRRDWKKLPKYDAVIVDEAHYFSGMTSAMSKSLTKYLKFHGVPFVWLLTATPYLSTPWNIFTLARHLGISYSYMTFKEKFFTFRYVGRREVPVVKEGIEPEIAKLVNSMGSVVRMDECADVPEQVFETEYFKNTKEQEAAMKVISQEDINPIVRFTRFHQVENGTLKGDGYVEDIRVPYDKLERILDLVKENKKIAIVCRYNLQVDYLRNSILVETGKTPYVIRGDVKNRDEITLEVNKRDEAIVIINAACSEGYELATVPVIVFASLSFSYKDYKQMCGRFLRINKLKKNVYIHLVTSSEKHDGVDEAVFGAIMKKQDFDIEIFANEHRT